MGQLRDKGLCVSSREANFGVVRTQVGCHGLSIRSFVEARLLKADGESTHRPATMNLEEGGYQG